MNKYVAKILICNEIHSKFKCWCSSKFCTVVEKIADIFIKEDEANEGESDDTRKVSEE